MNAKRMLGGACLLAALAVVGCDKTVQLTVTNVTAQERSVELLSPERVNMGEVGPNGGKLPFTLKVDEEDLPATVAVQAGDKKLQFTLRKDSPDKLWIDIQDDGIYGPRDAKTKVHIKREVQIKNTPVEQKTVVE